MLPQRPRVRTFAVKAEVREFVSRIEALSEAIVQALKLYRGWDSMNLNLWHSLRLY